MHCSTSVNTSAGSSAAAHRTRDCQYHNEWLVRDQGYHDECSCTTLPDMSVDTRIYWVTCDPMRRFTPRKSSAKFFMAFDCGRIPSALNPIKAFDTICIMPFDAICVIPFDTICITLFANLNCVTSRIEWRVIIVIGRGQYGKR
jgi:hypothetical protein